jgi:hypothetical protein
MWPNLAGLVVAAALAAGHGGAHSTTASGYVSPDRQWSLSFTRKHGYGNLDLTQRATGRTFRMYHSNDGCCQGIRWLRPHLLIFVDDYRTFTLDPATKKVTRIAGFSNFVVSRDGRLVAGWADCGGHCAETVGVVAIDGRHCRRVPRRPDQDDNALRFSADGRSLTILRRFFDVKQGEPTRNALPTPWHQVTVPLAALKPAATC